MQVVPASIASLMQHSGQGAAELHRRGSKLWHKAADSFVATLQGRSDAPGARYKQGVAWLTAQPAIAAIQSGASAGGALYLAQCVRAGQPVASAVVWLATLIGAATFGWWAVSHPPCALGGACGALLGSAIVAAYAPVPGFLALIIICLTTWLGISVGHLATCISPAADNSATRKNEGIQNDLMPPLDETVCKPTDKSDPTAIAGLTDDHLNDTQSPAWRQRLRTKLAGLCGPYATLYQNRGLRQLASLERAQGSEDKEKLQIWMEKFDRLVDTMAPIAKLSDEDSAQFYAKLERELSGIWGNQAVKTMIREHVTLQQSGVGKMGVVCITGASGTGKNLIANALKAVYSAHHEISLQHKLKENFLGFSSTYTGSEPSCVTQAMLGSPDQYCLLHIDEIDIASPNQQQALLALLGEENQFVDEYFGLPINKSRLFAVCTMKLDKGAENSVYPDLWNRLKQRAVVTSSVSEAGFIHIAEQSLARALAQMDYPTRLQNRAGAAAAQICASRPQQEPARYITGCVDKVVARALLLKAQLGQYPKIDEALVCRALDRTWMHRVAIQMPSGQNPKLAAATTSPPIYTAFFGLIRQKNNHVYWAMPLAEGASFELFLDDNFLTCTRKLKDGTKEKLNVGLDVGASHHIYPEANEIVTDEQLNYRRTQLQGVGDVKHIISLFNAIPVAQLQPCLRDLGNEEYLITLPILSG